MSYKSSTPENPVGPSRPAFQLNMPLWQVFVILAAVASVVTIFKLFEQHYIAPRRAIQWQPFTPDAFTQSRRQRRNVLVIVDSVDEALNRNMLAVLDDREVRRAVYLSRSMTLRIPQGRSSSEVPETMGWIGSNALEINLGGFAFFESDPKQPPRTIRATDVSTETLLDLLLDN